MPRVVVTGGCGKAAEEFLAAADTVMEKESRDLMQEVYPGVSLREVEGRETVLSLDKTRRKLGYFPEHSWRDNV